MLFCLDDLNIELGSAIRRFVFSPFRRIAMLQTVEEDLKHERILPPGGFGGTWGSIKFLYRSGGIASFYRGALLDVGVTCVMQTALQRLCVIPLLRRLPFRRSGGLLTIILQAALICVACSPLRVLVDTIIANMTTDFIPRNLPRRSDAPAPLFPGQGKPGSFDHRRASGDCVSANRSLTGGDGGGSFVNNNSIYRNMNNLPNSSFAIPVGVADGCAFAPRFSSILDIFGAVCRTIPTRSLFNKLFPLLLAESIISNYMNAKGFCYFFHRVGASKSPLRAWLLVNVYPIGISLLSAALTYPVLNFSFTHFVRVRLYERLEVEARRRLEEEQTYPHHHSAITNDSFNRTLRTMKSKCSQRQLYIEDTDDEHDPDALCHLIEQSCTHLFHEEVREYIRCGIDLDGFLSLYRGFPMFVASVVASSLLAGVVRMAVRHATGAVVALLRSAPRA
ncbi:hypothetical protein STCU_11787 [Strigomonas culicis]|uniref:Mitochondrial carrier protein n=1 Tax=Strigomonas culicis TaxID=28005 RepID=S9TCK6_9TRYP|nr:hypothetical protein STCU_11787 [Strigomonas culicis]|eukprot:EPY15757.1 hypothetical protein STCU_11787 [Strigomonas culicis]